MSIAAIGSKSLSWFLAPVPLARVAVFRILIYAFVVLDILWVRTSVIPHGYVPELYRPTWLARAIHLPPPTPGQGTALLWFLLVSCVAAIAAVAVGRLQRTTGVLVAAGFWVWMLNSQGFGYISHDHLALMVAVTVLPTASLTTPHPPQSPRSNETECRGQCPWKCFSGPSRISQERPG